MSGRTESNTRPEIALGKVSVAPAPLGSRSRRWHAQQVGRDSNNLFWKKLGFGQPVKVWFPHTPSRYRFCSLKVLYLHDSPPEPKFLTSNVYWLFFDETAPATGEAGVGCFFEELVRNLLAATVGVGARPPRPLRGHRG